MSDLLKRLGEAASRPRLARARDACLWAILGALGMLAYASRFICTALDSGEQPAAGMVATALLDGLAAPIWYYQNHLVTGTLAFGALLCPLYAAFGSTFLALKIVSAAMVVGGGVFWTLAVRRAWGLTAAVVFFLWLVLPPPFLEWHFHQSYGGRSESLLFSGLLVWLFVRVGEAPPRFFACLGFGMLAGFACFFCFDNLAVAAALAIACVWRWRAAAFSRSLWPAAIGFLCLFSLTLFAAILPPAIAEYSRSFRTGQAAAVWRGWLDLFGWLLPVFPLYGGVAGRWLSAAWSALAAPGLALAAWRGIRDRDQPSPKSALAVFAVAHFFCYAAAYGLSTQKILLPPQNDLFFDLRYLYTLAPTMLALSTFFLLRLRRWKWLVLLPFLAGGFANVRSAGTYSIADFKAGLARMEARRGDDYYSWIHTRLPQSWRAEPAAFQSVAKLPRRWRAAGWRELGSWLRSARALDLLANDRALPADARRNLAAGAGAEFVGEALARGRRQHGDFAEGRPAFLAQLRGLDRDAAQGFAVGMGYGMASRVRDGYDARFAGFADLVCSLLPQLADDDCRQALIRGEAVSSGEWCTTPAAAASQFVDACVSRYEPAAEDERLESAGAAFRSGWAEGNARRVAANFNRVVVHGDFAADLRNAFAEMAIDLRPTGAAEEYDLVILP